MLERHGFASRVIHWTVAGTFMLCLFSGLPIWTPVFGWLGKLFGGLAMCGWLHPLFGAAFFGSSFVMFVHWVSEMKLDAADWRWLKSRGKETDVGKYNGGQKAFFFLTALGALGLFASGFVLWFPESMPQALREASWVLHDVTFILFAVAIVLHIYLGTAGEPGTFRAMTRGTVEARWAKFHHPRWFRESR
jgi:formate dehydrogenase subunit gamma